MITSFHANKKAEHTRTPSSGSSAILSPLRPAAFRPLLTEGSALSECLHFLNFYFIMPVRNVNVMPDNSRCDTHDKEYDVDDGSYLPRRPGGISDVTAESRKKGPYLKCTYNVIICTVIPPHYRFSSRDHSPFHVIL